jgi:hypothetical protein
VILVAAFAGRVLPFVNETEKTGLGNSLAAIGPDISTLSVDKQAFQTGKMGLRQCSMVEFGHVAILSLVRCRMSPQSGISIYQEHV